MKRLRWTLRGRFRSGEACTREQRWTIERFRAEGRADVTSMPDPLALPPGKYVASRHVVARAAFGGGSVVLYPGDTLTVPEPTISDA